MVQYVHTSEASAFQHPFLIYAGEMVLVPNKRKKKNQLSSHQARVHRIAQTRHNFTTHAQIVTHTLLYILGVIASQLSHYIPEFPPPCQ